MNSLQQLEREEATSSAPARPVFDWVEVFAVPVASALMETQPIALGLLLIQPYLLGKEGLMPSAITITLLMLGMQWWQMWVQRKGSLQSNPTRPSLLSIAGFPVALVILALSSLGQPEALGDPSFLVVACALIIWFWYRGVRRAQEPLSDAYLTGAFRIGFLVMLVVMLFAILASLSNNNTLANELGYTLPIFFLSGMIALSFTRIGVLRREQHRHPGSSGKESTGRWLTALTVTWGALVAISVALESLPLDWIMLALSPLWFALLFIGQGILFLFSFLAMGFVFVIGLALAGFIWVMNLLLGAEAPDTAEVQERAAEVMPQVQNAGANNPALTILLTVLVLAIVLFIVLRFTTSKKKKVVSGTAEEEEVRETLDRETVLQERREEKKKRQPQGIVLEALDPASMRARYRDFLQAMAAQGEETQRRPSETPLEFQKRLLTIARRRRLLRDNEDAEILHAMTLAYAQERYGGKHVESARQQTLEGWIPRIAQKFASSTVPATQPASQWSATKSRWGED